MEHKSKRDKGKVLEELIDSVISDLGLHFNKEYENPNANKKGEHYCDHENDYCQIEDKYWSCKEKKYKIDVNMAYKQIINRYNFTTPLNILIITDPVWIPHAKELVKFHGIHIIELHLDHLEDNYSKAYWLIREKFVELYCVKSTVYEPNSPLSNDFKMYEGQIFDKYVIHNTRYRGLPYWKYLEILSDPYFLGIMSQDLLNDLYLAEFTSSLL